MMMANDPQLFAQGPDGSYAYGGGQPPKPQQGPVNFKLAAPLSGQGPQGPMLNAQPMQPQGDQPGYMGTGGSDPVKLAQDFQKFQGAMPRQGMGRLIYGNGSPEEDQRQMALASQDQTQQQNDALKQYLGLLGADQQAGRLGLDTKLGTGKLDLDKQEFAYKSNPERVREMAKLQSIQSMIAANGGKPVDPAQVQAGNSLVDTVLPPAGVPGPGGQGGQGGQPNLPVTQAPPGVGLLGPDLNWKINNDPGLKGNAMATFTAIAQKLGTEGVKQNWPVIQQVLQNADPNALDKLRDQSTSDWVSKPFGVFGNFGRAMRAERADRPAAYDREASVPLMERWRGLTGQHTQQDHSAALIRELLGK